MLKLTPKLLVQLKFHTFFHAAHLQQLAVIPTVLHQRVSYFLPTLADDSLCFGGWMFALAPTPTYSFHPLLSFPFSAALALPFCSCADYLGIISSSAAAAQNVSGLVTSVTASHRYDASSGSPPDKLAKATEILHTGHKLSPGNKVGVCLPPLCYVHRDNSGK